MKDSFHQYVVNRSREAVNPARTGTQAAARDVLDVPAGGSSSVRLLLSANRPAAPFGPGFESTFASRLAEADELHGRIAPKSFTEDQRRVRRQALAGML